MKASAALLSRQRSSSKEKAARDADKAGNSLIEAEPSQQAAGDEIENNEAEAHSFVVRLWRERAGNGGPLHMWRGTIDHVGSGTRHHFRELESIVSFIRRRVERRRSGIPRWLAWVLDTGRRLIRRT